MTRFPPLGRLLPAVLLAACGAASPPPPPAARAAAAEDQLAHLVARYWEESAPGRSSAGADISPQSLADSLALERRFLAAALALPHEQLGGESALTYALFKRERELAVEGFTYPAELLPVNPARSMPLWFARTGADGGPGAADAYARWTVQAIVNMRDGARRGYTLPRVLVEDMLPLLDTLARDAPDNVFYRDHRSLPPALVREKILPAYRALYDYLRTDYLPASRTSVGLYALPLGEAWYAYLLARESGVRVRAAQIHAQGEAEAERLHGRLQSLLAEAGYAGNAQGYLESVRRDPQLAFKTPEQAVTFYTALKAQVAAALPASFGEVPAEELAIRAAEGFAPQPAPQLTYAAPAPGAAGAGILYLNAGAAAQPLLADAPLFLREALPGRYFQLASQRSRTDLPSFRRFGGSPAYIEGWALYAATQGEPLGVYRDAESKFMALAGQLQCAVGSVIDTGLHARRWSRAQAIDYLRSKLPMEESGARALVDRAIALPAEAVGCMVGERKIAALRQTAEQALGARFELRAFHQQILEEGALPLDLLEESLKRWQRSVR